MLETCTKPNISVDEINLVLKEHFGGPVNQLEKITAGKMKTTYSFSHEEQNYVIRFSNEDAEFCFEKYLYETLEGQAFPIPRVFFDGIFKQCYYAVSEKIEGASLDTLSKKSLNDALPSIMIALNKLHSIDVGQSSGYGGLDKHRNGSFNTFVEYLEGFFSNDLEGFWKGWHDLFEQSCLDQQLFKKLYQKMMLLAPYCEGERCITHTDFHYHNVLIHHSEVAGIIDWGRVSYLDLVFDVVTLALEFPDEDILDKVEAFYRERNIVLPNLKERFLCAALCHSLDGMRFWAKLGSERSYKAILGNLMNFIEID